MGLAVVGIGVEFGLLLLNQIEAELNRLIIVVQTEFRNQMSKVDKNRQEIVVGCYCCNCYYHCCCYSYLGHIVVELLKITAAVGYHRGPSFELAGG
jgi:hypothetical protein